MANEDFIRPKPLRLSRESNKRYGENASVSASFSLRLAAQNLSKAKIHLVSRITGVNTRLQLPSSQLNQDNFGNLHIGSVPGFQHKLKLSFRNSES